jgi:hypothetical protein
MSRKERLTISLDDILFQVLKDEKRRRRISLAGVINQELAERFVKEIATKEAQQEQTKN